jgi:ABC-type transport system substrate-binding protein
MREITICLLALVASCLGLFAVAVAVEPEPAPVGPADLLADAAKAPPAIATVLRELATPADEVTLSEQGRLLIDPLPGYLKPGAAGAPRTASVLGSPKQVAITGTNLFEVRYFEPYVLERLDTLLKQEDALAGAWAAEKVLRATLRFSLSRRQPTSPSDNPWLAYQGRLSNRLVDVRRRLLDLLGQRDDLADALKWADVWLPLYSPQSPLGDSVRALWVRHAERLIKRDDYAGARHAYERIEDTFADSPQAQPLRKQLKARSETLLTQARDLPDSQATASLQQALGVWPRLPGLRDELEKRKQRYQVLHVAVRDLPEFLSPGLAFSDAERQTVELIFEGLLTARHDPKLGTEYRSALADATRAGTGTRRALVLRRDAYWSDGERFTGTDVRHTVELLAKPGQPDAAAWGDRIEPLRLTGDPFRLDLVYKQGQFDPWWAWRSKMLPQHPHGKPLTRADDPEFARRPVGTGPYMFQGKEGSEGRVAVVLRANPQYLRHGMPAPGSVREIRLYAWKDGEPLGQPPPHLVLDVLPSQAAILRKEGYSDLRSVPIPRVWFLGVNHRRGVLANLQVRLALAHAIDRQGLLERHLRSDIAGSVATTLNGVFPRGSWANSPEQRVPEELYRPVDARAGARKAAADLAKADWTLKYPGGDPRLDAAFKELADHVAKVLADAKVHVTIRPVPLGPRALQTALRERDFDLIYHSLDQPDAPEALWPLFDSHPSALAAGGSSFLGVEDAQLQSLLSSALHHRNFPQVRTFMQDVHAHMNATMPLIPLWQLPYSVAIHRSLHAPELDALAVFGNALEWKVSAP